MTQEMSDEGIRNTQDQRQCALYGASGNRFTRCDQFNDRSLAGLLTFREVIRAVHANQGSVGQGTVGEHMTRDVLTMSPDTDVNDIRRLMLERHARYVPVMDGKVLLGVMSFYDVAKSILEAQNFENTLLKAYIRDWPAESNPEGLQ
jgi:CBS domain-containing protein